MTTVVFAARWGISLLMSEIAAWSLRTSVNRFGEDSAGSKSECAPLVRCWRFRLGRALG